MPRRKPRTLREEEVALWKQVIEKAVPLHPEHPARPLEKTLINPKKPPRPVQSFRVGETATHAARPHNLAPGLSEQINRQPVSMDRKRFTQMRKGRLSPEARIDLHGLTLAQAHPALSRFILEAVTDGRRLVLVITGKGKSKPDTGPIPERHGALRHQVPHWLNSPPIKAHVLQITEAHTKHGGQGAYYVYLRRSRQ